MIYCIDFDGTIVTHEFPRVGRPVPMALETMKQIIKNDDKIVLFTMRSGAELEDAVKYLKENGVELYGINTNPTQKSWTTSPKAYGQSYIDDASIGMKLIPNEDKGGRPYVDWNFVRDMITEKYGVVWDELT